MLRGEVVRSIGIVIFFIVLASANPSMATDLHGSGQSVVDGDEFILCEGNACTNIRLCGIDTPSKGKPGYDKTISALTKLVVGKKVLCRPVSQGSVCDHRMAPISFGRTVAQCFVEEATVDVAGVLIAARLGCDRVKGTKGFYSKDHPEWECPGVKNTAQ